MPRRSARSAAALCTTIAAAAVMAGCSTPPTPLARPGAAVIEALETRLLQDDWFSFGFHITAEGATTADVTGICTLNSHDVNLMATGYFGDKPLHVAITSTTQSILGHTSDERIETARGRELRDSIVLGLTRMGLLHNIARLFSGNAPDHHEGGVREWVEFDEARLEPNGDLTMYVRVSGVPSADAVLKLNRDGLPASRTQTVRFEQGEMTVRENYTVFPDVQRPATPPAAGGAPVTIR